MEFVVSGTLTSWPSEGITHQDEDVYSEGFQCH